MQFKIHMLLYINRLHLNLQTYLKLSNLLQKNKWQIINFLVYINYGSAYRLAGIGRNWQELAGIGRNLQVLIINSCQFLPYRNNRNNDLYKKFDIKPGVIFIGVSNLLLILKN
jgi:hypothetical protein